MIIEIREIVLICVALFYLIIGSIEDIKTREIMDYSNFSLISLGIGLNLFYAIIFDSWITFLHSLAGLAIFVGIAFLMYYAGQWGGGDSKMLMGLGALIGLEFSFTNLPFIVDFFINTLIVGAIYGMLWSLILSIKHLKKVSKSLKERLNEKKVYKKYLLFLSVSLIIFGLFLHNSFTWIIIGSIIFISFFAFYLWNYIKAIEKVIMYKHLKIEQLTEGDWIVDDIIIDNKRICGPKDLGISNEQILELKKLKKDNKINKVLVKEGIPFVPSFLFAFIVTLLVRNFWLFLIR